MNSFFDTFSDIAKIAAAITIGLAMYYHRRYIVGPSTTRNCNEAVFYWSMSGIFVAVAALSDAALSTTATAVIVALAVVCPVVPVVHLRRTRRRRTPTFLDHIATDDIIDRAHTARNQD